MPMLPALLTLAAILGALTITSDVRPEEAARCSVRTFPHGLAAGEAALLGNALPDTVETGAGEVAPLDGDDEYWRGAGPIHGQRIQVARHAGADSGVIARAFDRNGSSEVIIVPWSYGTMCQPVPWTQSAAWVRPGEQGVFTVRLRPERHWSGGLPTFDAFMAAFEPYPNSRALRAGLRGTDSLSTPEALTPPEYFELLSGIPDYAEIAADPDAAWASITEWRTQHPGITSRFPATRILHWIGNNIVSLKRRQVLRTIQPAIAGTWRFVVKVNDGQERTFYARTRRSPTTDWRTSLRPEPADPAAAPPRPDGYHLIASGALTADSLPTGCGPGERTMARENYIAALEPGLSINEPPMEWSGLVDVRLLRAQFPGDAVLANYMRDSMMQRRRQPHDQRFAPARFTMDDDGVMRVTQTIQLDNGNRIVVRGERVSTDVIACDG